MSRTSQIKNELIYPAILDQYRDILNRLDQKLNRPRIIVYQLTIIIHHSGLLLAAVHWEADDLYLHEGINDLTEKCYTAVRYQRKFQDLSMITLRHASSAEFQTVK